MASILSATSLRVDVADVPTIDGLSLETTGSRVLVLGAARALFQAAAGLRRIAHGDLLVEGRTPVAALRSGLVGCAPLDPPMPPKWTLVEYVGWGARLGGHEPGAAAALAADALGRMDLTPVATTRIGAGAKAVRRSTVIAAALAAAPAAILIEDPVAGLPDEDARALGETIVRALADRRWAVFAGRAQLDSPLARSADEVLVLDGTQVAARGTPSEVAIAAEAFAVFVAGDVAAFVAALEELGARLLAPTDARDPARISVHLGSLTATDLLRAAVTSNATILELRPLARAFT